MARKGRPKIDSKVRKGRIFNFRVSEAEHEKLEEAAAIYGESASEWVRKTALARAGKAISVRRVDGE